MNKYIVAAAFSVMALFLATALPAAATPPSVKIRIAQYDKTIEFVMPKGGEWVSGDKKGKIQPDKTLRIEGHMSAPAVRRCHLMVGSAGINKPELLAEVESRFKQYTTHHFIAGHVPTAGYPDNRITFVGVGIFEDESKAKEQQNKLAAEGISSWIFYENINPAQGKLSLYQGKKKIATSEIGFELVPNASTKLKKAEFAKGFSWHGFADRQFAGRLFIGWSFENVIDCIEQTDLETLIIGIVPSEISSSAPESALQAQAVAARGEMLSKRGTRHYNEGFDFCSEQHCQVYKGIQSVDKTIGASIKNTFGQILENHEGGILDAVYSANCGGHSSSNDKIWVSNPDIHLQGVYDLSPASATEYMALMAKGHKGQLKTPFKLDLTDHKQAEAFILNPPKAWCSLPGVEGADKFRWQKSLSENDWKKVEAAAEVGRIRSIDEFIREVSGRIISIKIVGSSGEKTVLRELAIRKLFGMLRSSNFSVEWKRDKDGFIVGASFTGAGWGHGVGMCQTGAQSMAKAGHSFTQILLHYFPGAKLKKLY
ncbi:MAG: SpoIID/LytB domain-containing protein [Candidatus Riflebacteria bacterium]|nr:SpoIID/LytB domain-containing protein [Candidatus Riflebacteria bacterium]